MKLIKTPSSPALYPGGIRLKFVPLFLQFISAAEKGELITPAKGEHYSAQTLRVYRQTYHYLLEYEERFGIICIDDVTPNFGEMFTVFLSEKNVSKNTSSSHLCRIKSVLNRAYKAGLTVRTGYGITIYTEPATTVFNTVAELKMLADLDLSQTEGLGRVRDIYLMNCMLGMRWSDLSRFLASPLKFIKEFDGVYVIEIDSQKTGNKAVIPIGRQVSYILKKRKFNFGENFSYQYFNRSIKVLARYAGIASPVEISRTYGGKKKNIEKEKWEVMSSHTSRRTFVSLCVMYDINQQNIMKMTGHSSQSSFQSYVRISQLQNAIKIVEHPFFKIRI